MYSPQKLHKIAYAGSVVKGVKTMFFPAILIFFNMREELFSGSISPYTGSCFYSLYRYRYDQYLPHEILD